MEWVAADVVRAAGAGVAGVLAGVPIAAIAYSAPARGRVRFPDRWWVGGHARPELVVATTALTGAVATVIGLVLPPTLALPSFWLVAVGGVGLAVTDVRRRRLPHPLTGTLWISCLMCFAVAVVGSGDAGPLIRALSTGLVTIVVFFAIALMLPGQLGLGDVALAGTITFSLGWLSWQAVAFGLLAGLLLQLPVALVATRRRPDEKTTPMGPALVAGWFFAVVLTAR